MLSVISPVNTNWCLLVVAMNILYFFSFFSVSPSKLAPMAGSGTDAMLTTSTPVLTQWKLTQDEENGNTIEVPSPVQNGNSSPRPVLKKTESIEVVDCKIT